MSYDKLRTTRKAKRGGPDFYSTPKWATLALMKREEFTGSILEPACGDGRMAEVISKFNKVKAYDLYDRGYGKTGVDFIKRRWKIQDNVITNPPFAIAEDFILKAIDITKYKVAIFLRLNFLASRRRHSMFLETPLKNVWIFCRRVAMGLPGKEPGRMVVYVWAVWDKSYKGKTRLGWIND